MATPRIAPGAAQAPVAPPVQSAANDKQADRRINNMPTPDTYHVLLRSDQLDQISQTFVISSVARGSTAYSVAPANGAANLANNNDAAVYSQNGLTAQQNASGLARNSQIQNGGNVTNGNGEGIQFNNSRGNTTSGSGSWHHLQRQCYR